MSEETDCCICLSPPTDAIQCIRCLGSSGTVCRECFRNWARTLGSPKCPTCKNFFINYSPPPENTWGLMIRQMLYSFFLIGLALAGCLLPLVFSAGWIFMVWIWIVNMWYFWPMIQNWRFFVEFIKHMRQLSTEGMHTLLGVELDQPIQLQIDLVPGFANNLRTIFNILGMEQAISPETGNLILPAEFVQELLQELSTFQFGLTTGFKYQIIIGLCLFGCICMKSYEFRYPSSDLDRVIDQIPSKKGHSD